MRAMAYLLALVLTNLRNGFARPGYALFSALLMLANNLILLFIWIVYFANFSQLRGWRQDDMALMMGIVAWAFGLVMLVAGGVRDMGRVIVDGGLDVHLGRPRHPLPSLLMSRSLPSGAGDMISAFVFWFGFAGRSLSDLPALILFSTAAAVVLLAVVTIAHCLVFWRPRALQLCEEAFELFLMTAFWPQHTFGLLVRLVLFTIFPAALVALVPVQAVRDGDVVQMLVLLAAAAIYSGLAILVFERGLRRYSSGNRLIENR